LSRIPRIAAGTAAIRGNVGVADKKVTLPHYMSMFL